MEWKRCIDATNSKTLRLGDKYLIKSDNLKQSAGSLCKVICDQNGNLIGKYTYDLRFESITQPKLEMFKESYKILSFIRKSGEIIKKHQNGLFGLKNGKYGSDYFTNETYYQIHSIKRLPDGEVFTIGDYIMSTKGFSAPIQKIVIANKTVYVYGKGMGNPTTLQQIKHIEQPLFQTHDGVDVYKRDHVWYVSKGYLVGRIKKNSKALEGFEYFSTKEKAEEYRDYNKPIYSKHDMSNILENWTKTSKPLSIVIDEYSR